MPGSTVSGCHMCHMHSHNNDSLVKTVPLHRSRTKSRNSRYNDDHHSHHDYGKTFSLSRDDEEILRSNSISRIPRREESTHSLPGSRTNSLSRYHQDVSVMPDGGMEYMRGIRQSSSTRSLNGDTGNYAMNSPRTTTLPRLSSLAYHPEIHPKPEVLVNTLPPRTRTSSRLGSLSRSGLDLAQENSQDYYLDLHCKRLGEEKKKQRFNVQTVLLIGCYSFLVMIAIVIGVVLCYQNGWLGFGSSDEKADLDLRDSSAILGNNPKLLESLERNHKPDVKLSQNHRSETEQRSRTKLEMENVRHFNPGFSGTDVTVSKNMPVNERNPTVGNIPNNQNLGHIFANGNHPFIHSSNIPVQSRIPSRPGISLPGLSNSNGRIVNGDVPRENIDTRNNPVVRINHPEVIAHAGFPLNLMPRNNAPSNLNSFQVTPRNNLEKIKVGEVDSNTVAKALLPERNPTNLVKASEVDNNKLKQNLERKNEVNKEGIKPSQDDKQESEKKLTSSSPGNTETGNEEQSPILTTQELIDLLAIRRLRDLLNSDRNTKDILNILRNVKPSDESRLEGVKKESRTSEELPNKMKVLPGNLQKKNVPTPLQISIAPKELTNSDGAKSGNIFNENDNIRSIVSIIRDQGGALNSNINSPQDVADLDAKNRNNLLSLKSILENARRKTVQSTPANQNPSDDPKTNKKGSNHDILRALAISKLVNQTIEGAIINLINQRIADNRRENQGLNKKLAKSGISVLPFDQSKIKALLESNPQNVKQKLGPLTNDTLRTIQILNRLIEINKNKQKAMEGGPSLPSLRRPRKKVDHNFGANLLATTPKSILNHTLISSTNSPLKQNSKLPNVANISNPFLSVAKANLRSSFTDSKTVSSIPRKTELKNRKPEFAVMFKAETPLKSNAKGSNVHKTHLPAQLESSLTKRTLQSSIKNRSLKREEVTVVSGGIRELSDQTNPVLVTSWAHTDSRGTISNGKVHSDGSFAFTNCRPAQVCIPNGD